MNKENENSLIILDMIKLFKDSNWLSVIDKLKKNEIEANYSENIISDYAAMWLEEKHIIDFFKEIKKLNADPASHDSIIKNCVTHKKNQAVKFLIENGALIKNKDQIVYMLNIAIMEKNTEAFLILLDNIEKNEINNIKLLLEENPSILNRAIQYNNPEILKIIIERDICNDFLFSKETIKFLKDRDIKKTFIKILTEKYNIDFFEETENSIKMLEVKILEKELTLKNNLIKKIKI